MEKKPFPLVNIAKYSKNHYQYTGNIWYDLALCLQADDYGPFFGYSHNPDKTPQQECYDRRKNIANLIMTKIDPYMPEYSRRDLMSNISPDECWRIGYYTDGWRDLTIDNEPLPAYDYWEAVARAYISSIKMLNFEELGYDNWDKLEECNIPELQKTTEQK